MVIGIFSVMFYGSKIGSTMSGKNWQQQQQILSHYVHQPSLATKLSMIHVSSLFSRNGEIHTGQCRERNFMDSSVIGSMQKK